MKYSIAFLLPLLLANALIITAQSRYGRTDQYLQLIREEFSAEAAFKTTEYVSKQKEKTGPCSGKFIK